MDTFLDQARLALTEAENAVRRILSAASKKGAYDEVSVLSDVARLFGHMRERLEAGSAGDGKVDRLSGADSPTRDDGPVSHELRRPHNGQPRERARAPTFVRDGVDLIKIGWSRTKGSDYEHRAPLDVAHLAVKSILKAGGAKRLVSSNKFLPLVDSDDVEVPSYQSYLCIAWLVQEGFLGRHGRRGYTVFDADGIERRVQLCWEALSLQDIR